jgi:hypothetical protein
MFRDFRLPGHWESSDDALHNANARLYAALRDSHFSSVREFLHLMALQLRGEMLELARYYLGPEGSSNLRASPTVS